jgi:LemA protein
LQISYWFIGLLLAIVLWLIYSYNALVNLRNRKDEAYSSIDAFLKRRYDLVPNLVNLVKGYTDHEQSTLLEATKARSAAASAQNLQAKAQKEAELSGAVRSLFAVSENYPELKASQVFLQLQQDLTELEDGINRSRRYYNAVVRDYNNYCQMFPFNLTAKLLRFKSADFFELTRPQLEREAVKV